MASWPWDANHCPRSQIRRCPPPEAATGGVCLVFSVPITPFGLSGGLLLCHGCRYGFLLLYSCRQEVLHLSDADAGFYVLALLASTTVGNVLWGYLAMPSATNAWWSAGLSALVWRHPGCCRQRPDVAGIAFAGVFLFMGLGASAIQLTALTFLMELAPPSQRPTYLGLASLASAPFACAAPLFGGALADHWSYNAVFVPAAACAIVGGLLIARCVSDPRSDRIGPCTVSHHQSCEQDEERGDALSRAFGLRCTLVPGERKSS